MGRGDDSRGFVHSVPPGEHTFTVHANIYGSPTDVTSASIAFEVFQQTETGTCNILVDGLPREAHPRPSPTMLSRVPQPPGGAP